MSNSTSRADAFLFLRPYTRFRPKTTLSIPFPLPSSESSTTSRPRTNLLVRTRPRLAQLLAHSFIAGTTELTKSFGWKGFDSFLQHDVQEFNRVLCDKLETKMKVSAPMEYGQPVTDLYDFQATAADGEIKRLFSGKMKSYVKCIDIDFESARSEDFYGACLWQPAPEYGY